MRKIESSLILALLLALIQGCAADSEDPASSDAGSGISLEHGKTRKSDVYEYFGQPTDVTYVEESGECIWTYASVKATVTRVMLLQYMMNNWPGKLPGFCFDRNGLFTALRGMDRSEYVSESGGAGQATAEPASDKGQSLRVKEEMDKLGLPFGDPGGQTPFFVPARD